MRQEYGITGDAESATPDVDRKAGKQNTSAPTRTEKAGNDARQPITARRAGSGAIAITIDPSAATPRATEKRQSGPFGPIFTGYTNNPEGAIEKLMAEKDGEVSDAFTHPELGPIAFVYGNEKMGLRHIAEKRGEDFVRAIPSILRNGEAIADDQDLPRAYIVQSTDPAHVAVIRLEWDGQQKTWLVTAFRDDDGKFGKSRKEGPGERRKGISAPPTHSNPPFLGDKVGAGQNDPTTPAPDPRFANNTLFTADKVAAAQARIRAKLGNLNSGIDPEMLVDGMTIAGAYIESGVRKFSDYAAEMVKALGNGVKPYLLSFYEGARRYPGLDTTGMDSVEDASNAFDALLAPADTATPAVGKANKAVSMNKGGKDRSGMPIWTWFRQAIPEFLNCLFGSERREEC